MADLIIKPSVGTDNKLIIQNQAGNDVLTTDNSGVTLGTVTAGTLGNAVVNTMYGFKARLNTASGIIGTHNAWQEVGSGTTSFGTGKWTVDRADGTFSVDTGRYTPAKAGFYAILGSFDWGRLDDAKTLYVTISKNATSDKSGANILAFERQMGSTTNTGMAISLSGIIELNGSSDYVSMFWNDSNAGNNTSVQTGTQLSGFYLGV
jgi:hypothetical protein